MTFVLKQKMADFDSDHDAQSAPNCVDSLMPGIVMNTRPHRCCQAFFSLLKTGSVAATSSELRVTCATIYNRIRCLETLTNQPLFLRSGMRLVPTKAGQLFANIVSEASFKSKPVRSIGELGWFLAASELGRFDLLSELNIPEENRDSTAIISECRDTEDAEKAGADYFTSQLSTDTERKIYQLWQRAKDKKATVPSVARVLTTCTSIAKGSMIGYLRLKSNGEILVEYANSRLKAAFGIKVCPIPYLDTLETGPAGLRASLFTACIVAQRPMSFSGALPHSAHIGLDYSRLILPAASPEMQAGRERWADSVIVIITNIPSSARVCRDKGESLHCLDRIAMG